MKKVYFVSLTILFSILHNITNGAEIRVEKAKQVCINFYYSKVFQEGIKYNDLSILETIEIKKEQETVAYIFNLNIEGWVLISAEDAVRPILAYNTTGNYTTSDVPPAFEDLLNQYINLIINVRADQLTASENVLNLWEKYSVQHETYMTYRATVGPLCNTVWHQLGPYNLDIPAYSQGVSQYCGHGAVGCVATTMAQIMKKWSYPAQGSGSKNGVSFETQYNWDEMPNSVPTVYSCDYNSDLAKINYHSGRAVDMKYFGSSAGTLTEKSINALETYFGYSSDAEYETASSYSNNEWINKLKTNLDGEMPLIYRGTNTGGGGGHAWVCDGYQDGDEFHFNMGWGPSYLPWCTLDGLLFPNQPSYANLTANHAAGFNIHPPTQLSVSDKITNQTEFSIHPNPTSNFFIVDFNSVKEQNVNLYVTNIKGEIVLESDFRISNKQKTKKINTNDLSNGIYILSIISNNKRVSKKLIIQ